MEPPKLTCKLHIAMYCALACSILVLPGTWGAAVERQTAGAGTWCVAKSDASSSELQEALDWACGQESGQGNVDCTAISTGGACDTPDTLLAHASYAFNLYFQNLNQAAGACDFNGCAQTTTTDPSLGGCSYPSSSSGSYLATGGNFSSPGPSSGSIAQRPNLTSLLIAPCALFALLLPFILKL